MAIVQRARRVLDIAIGYVRAAWLRFEIAETEAYLNACARDGLVDSLHLRFWRDRVAEMRVELALIKIERM